MHSHTRGYRCKARCVAILMALSALTATGCAATQEKDAPGVLPTSVTPPVQAAMVDAAQRTGLNPNRLKVASVERVTWSDGSLGCPEPDLMYTQALVPGYRIRIDAEGKTLEYHTDQRGTLTLCPPERSKPPVSPR